MDIFWKLAWVSVRQVGEVPKTFMKSKKGNGRLAFYVPSTSAILHQIVCDLIRPGTKRRYLTVSDDVKVSESTSLVRANERCSVALVGRLF